MRLSSIAIACLVAGATPIHAGTGAKSPEPTCSTALVALKGGGGHQLVRKCGKAAMAKKAGPPVARQPIDDGTNLASASPAAVIVSLLALSTFVAGLSVAVDAEERDLPVSN